MKKSIGKTSADQEDSGPEVKEQVKKADELMKSLLEVKGEGN